MTNKDKPGWKTSEFWLAAAGQIVVLLVLFGVLTDTDSEKLTPHLNGLIVAGFAAAASAWQIVEYIRARSAVKSAPEQLTMTSTSMTTAWTQPSPKEKDREQETTDPGRSPRPPEPQP